MSVLRVKTQKGEVAALVADHVVVVFRNSDGTAAVSLTNGEMLDLADRYDEFMSRFTSMQGRRVKETSTPTPRNNDGVLSWLQPQGT